MKRSRLLLHLTSLAALVGLESVPAQINQTWIPAGPDDFWNLTNPNWDAGTNWTDNNNAIFGGAADTIEVTVPVIINDLTFNSADYTISSAGAGNLVLGNDLASTITVTNAGETANVNETIGNSLLGASSLTKAGAGILNLNGTAANTHSAGTIISGGALTASHEGALGTGPVTNTATLNLNKALVTFSGLSTAMSGNGVTNVVALGTGANTVTLNGNYSGYTGIWNIGVGTVNGGGKVEMNGLDNSAATFNVLANATFFTRSGTHTTPILLNGGDTGESFGQLRLENATWSGPITLAGGITGSNDGFIGANGGVGIYSGNISETGASRALTKVGAGTSVLSGNNSYSGATRVLNGVLSAGLLNTTGNSGNVGTGSTISLGNGTTAATFVYTGTGETTDRVINLAGTSGNATLTQSGTGGLLKFTNSPTVTGTGSKTLVLNGSAGGSGEISGVIPPFNSGAALTTTTTAAFTNTATSILVTSVTGIELGAVVSGTGITGGQRVTAITGTGPFTVNLSAAVNAAGTLGQDINFALPNSLVKNGTGTWTLSGDNTFTGNVAVNVGALKITHNNALGAGAKTITVIPTTNPTSLPSLELDGSAGDLTLSSNLSFNTSYDALINFQPIPGRAAIINQAGNNTIAGNFTLPTGGGGTAFLSNAGNLTLTGTLVSTNATRPLMLRGESTGVISGSINNGTGTNLTAVDKDAGSGTWTLSGTNNYTGYTTVRAGTLKLDYSVNNNSKLANTAGALNLAGGTLDLSGGDHLEIVTSTTLAGSSSRVTRSSGSAILQLNAVTANGGAVTFGEDNIATTDNTNANGILPWARFGNVWGSNASGAPDGSIVAYTGLFTEVTRLGASSISDGIMNNVRINNGGTTGNITLGTAPLTAINSLLVDASAGPATIAPAAASDIFMIGDELGGTLWHTSASGGLIVGTTPNEGVLTTGNVSNGAPAVLTILNDSLTNPVTINSAVSNNGSDVARLTLGGNGAVVLNGDNTYSGVTVLGNGSAVFGGNPSLILTGNNTAVTANTQVGNGATLELRSANALGTTGVAPTSQLQLFNGSTLRLRADADTTFSGTNTIGGLNGATVGINVNQLTAAGTNRKLTISPGFTPFGNSVTINVTGGNGYTLEMGTIQDIINAASNLTLNPTTANLNIASFSKFNATANTTAGTLTLSGTGTVNKVTGLIANQANSAGGATSSGTGAVSVVKTGSSRWELMGENTYTGATTVREGILDLTGNRTANGGAIVVADTAGLNATVNLSNGTWSMGTGNLRVANQVNTSTFNQTGGSISFTGGDQVLVGAAGGNGTYNLSAGTITGFVNANRGVLLGINNSSTGTFNLSGTGTLAMGSSALQLSRSDATALNANGIFNQSGGTATFGSLTIGGGAGPAYTGNTGTMNLTGGVFTTAAFTLLAAADQSTAIINIGGTADVTLPAFPTVRGSGGAATVNFDGGILRPLAGSTTYMGGLTNAFIKAGGATFDVDSFKDITVTQSLLTAPASPGGGLTKAGVGNLTLTGANTYTGPTAVTAGALALEGGSQASPITVGNGAFLGFTLGLPTVSSSSVTFASGSMVRIPGIAVNPTSYTLMTAASFSGTPVLESAIPGYVLEVEGGTVLKLKPAAPGSGFASWASKPAFGLAVADQDPTDDPDNDGSKNIVEYALNGNPSISDPSILPTLDASGSTFVFSYQRLDDSLTDTTQIFQYGNDLIGWTDVIVPAASGTVGAATITVTNGTPADSISISIPKPAPGVTGIYFGRLKVTTP